MQWLKDQGLDQNTIVIFTTDNGAEVFTWPDGGNTPFARSKGMLMDGGYRVPAIVKWPGHVPAGSVSKGIISGLDWLPTLTSIAGNPNVKDQLLKGLTLDGKNYRVHLDGYDQTPMLTGKGPSNRHEIFYFAQTRLGAVRVDDWKYSFISQPQGWFGVVELPNIPAITNLRQDPYERMNWSSYGTANDISPRIVPTVGIREVKQPSGPRNGSFPSCKRSSCTHKPCKFPVDVGQHRPMSS